MSVCNLIDSGWAKWRAEAELRRGFSKQLLSLHSPKFYIAAELRRIWRSDLGRINILKGFKYLIDNSRDVMDQTGPGPEETHQWKLQKCETGGYDWSRRESQRDQIIYLLSDSWEGNSHALSYWNSIPAPYHPSSWRCTCEPPWTWSPFRPRGPLESAGDKKQMFLSNPITLPLWKRTIYIWLIIASCCWCAAGLSLPPEQPWGSTQTLI